MSADLWLEVDTGGSSRVEVGGTDENITNNLTPMLSAAGYPGHQAMVGAPAVEAGGTFLCTAERLKADPARFRAMNPANGWGDYEGAVRFCERMAAHCADHPRTVVGGWL